MHDGAHTSDNALPVSRRAFLKVVTLAAGGFAVGWRLPAGVLADGDDGADLNPFVRIQPDNTVTVVIKHLDKGQGITTGLTTIVAEELNADWSQMQFEFAPANDELYKNLFFGIQVTGGSTAIANSWMQMRQAGAAARAMLVAAAAERFGVPVGGLRVEKGRVTDPESGRSASFGDLATLAADQAPPAEPVLKDPKDFTLIGATLPRLDSPSKTDGTATYTLDVTRPGMLVALVAHPPRFGAVLASFNADKAKKISGVRHVVAIPRGVAVVADGFWAATRGREALEVQWDFTNAEMRGSAEMLSDYKETAKAKGASARLTGDAEAALADAEAVIEAEFDFPFLAHATMEPMDCVVDLKTDRCDVFSGAQMPTVDRQIVAGIVGLPLDKVYVHTHFAGGSFGRRAVPDSDYAAEAAMVAKAIGGTAPVKLIWTREDDLHGGRYRPMSFHRLRGGLDADGRLVAWDHRIVMQTFLKDTPFEILIEGGVDGTSVEGARGLPYDIPNVSVDLHLVDNGVTTLWWRSVGHTHNGYVTEVFFDMLAKKAGQDPGDLRRSLLRNHPRHLQVLETVLDKSGWGTPLAARAGARRGRGVAVHESFNSFVAQVAEVTVDDNGLKVDRIICAVDCGIAINPDIIVAQMEGGIGYGLSAALREAITLTDGIVDQDNFDTYEPLRINDMPDIEVHVVASDEAPTGVGEPGVPPVAPAVANAIADATGQRFYRLPFGDEIGTA